MATIELPPEAEMTRLVGLYSRPFPVGFREWCKVVSVPFHGEGVIPWKPERWHSVLDAAIVQRKDVYVLKEKDIFFTTNAILSALWWGMWKGNRSGIYLTYNNAEAIESADSFKERMRQVWWALPAWQRWLSPLVDCPADAFGSMGNIAWTHEKWLKGRSGTKEAAKSYLTIGPATENAGSAGRYTECVLDEMERYESPTKTLFGARASTRATGNSIVAGGHLTLDSSAESKLYTEFMLGDGKKTIGLFFGFGSRDGETPEAYSELEAEARKRGAQGLLELHRLHPRTAAEAISAFGRGLATAEALQACHVEKPTLPVPEGFHKWADLGTLHIFDLPKAGASYVYGLDPSDGKGGGNPASLVIMDASLDPPAQALLFRSDACSYADLALFTRELHDFGYAIVKGSLTRGYERSGGLVPEQNISEMVTALGMGISGVGRFENEYFFQQRGLPTGTHPEGDLKRLGYRTMAGKDGTKTTLLDSLREGFESHAFQQSDRFLGLEAPYWDRTGGRWDFKAPSTTIEAGHGDVTIALALAWMGCLAVQEWIQKRAVAAMGPKQAPASYYDWSKWKTPVGAR